MGILLLTTVALPAGAQQSLPDAPTPQNNAPAPSAEETQPPTAGSTSANTAPTPAEAQPQPTSDASEQPAAPKPAITTLAPGQKPSGTAAPQQQLFTLSRQLNFVQVPVTVKDDAGHLVAGLLRPNFTVMENGAKQNIVFFTSDPFPLSAALIVDVDLPNTALDHVRQTFGALVGAFSEFDELAVYTYSNVVRARQDFLGAQSEKTAATLSAVRKMDGSPSGPAIKDSPMTIGPSVNGRPIPDTGGSLAQPMVAYPESAVLNDAILRASVDLGHRDPTRRRILFIISDGREKGSTASYDDVKKVLLTNNITVFAVGVDTAAIPVYEKLARIRLPGQGSGNLLPKYASATGGEVLAELTRSAIEGSYARLTEEARNQYTLGYYSNAPEKSMAYRSIDVRVNRPKLKVYARDGYYPAPPAAK
jgi:VWFA-related protein